MKALQLKDWIGVALILAFVVAVGLLFAMAIPEKNEQLLSYMLGQLSGFVAAIVAFHYVSSKADEDKTANTGAAFRAIEATANAASGTEAKPDVVLKPGETAQAEDKP